MEQRDFPVWVASKPINVFDQKIVAGPNRAEVYAPASCRYSGCVDTGQVGLA